VEAGAGLARRPVPGAERGQTCGNDVARTWRLQDAPGAGIYVINAADGECLTVGPNGAAVQYRCDGDVARRWSFREVPNGPGVVTVNGGKP
jgi:Ricin-type beta-trefoil lectin domain-like